MHNRAGANMAGGVATRCWRRGRRERRRAGLFEVDEFWLPQVVERARSRARCCWRNLFRDQLDRYGELETIADRWAEASRRRRRRRSSCSTPTTRSSPTSAASREARRTSASRTTRWRCRRCSTPPTPSTAGAAAPPTSTTRSTWATSAATTARTAARAARTRRSSAHATSRCRARAAPRFTLRTPAGVARVELPLPGLYNVYNALGAAALGLALGAPLADDRRRPGRGRARVRPRGDVRARRPRDLSILLVKNPAGANEVLRTLRSRAASTTSSPCSTTTSPTGATSRGSGTPTSRCSPAACGA